LLLKLLLKFSLSFSFLLCFYRTNHNWILWWQIKFAYFINFLFIIWILYVIIFKHLTSLNNKSMIFSLYIKIFKLFKFFSLFHNWWFICARIWKYLLSKWYCFTYFLFFIFILFILREYNHLLKLLFLLFQIEKFFVSSFLLFWYLNVFICWLAYNTFLSNIKWALVMFLFILIILLFSFFNCIIKIIKLKWIFLCLFS